MNKATIKLLSLLILAVYPFTHKARAQESDSIRKLPTYKDARTRKIDVKHIAIDLRFDWQKKQAYGTATVTMTPLDPTNKITLDAGMLTINSIVLANEASLKFDYDGGDTNDGLSITLDRIYRPQENVTIKIDYHTNWVNDTDANNIWGSNGKGIRFFQPTSIEPKRRRQIWSMGEPESNRYWFPGYDAPNDLRTTEFKATVDKSLMVISNGTQVEARDNSDGTRTFYWKMETPYANHLTSFVVGEYVDFQQKYESIKLHNFGYPDEVDAVAASVARLPDMVKFYSELTGVKYPFPMYSQVFVQEAPWGIGYSTVATQTENMIDDYGTHADFLYLWDMLEGESLAQQWFGNYLTHSDWSEVWLSKAFARYFSELYDEHKNGREEFLLYQHAFDLGIYLGDWNSDIRQPVVNKNYESAEAWASSNHPYFHGASVLHMLRNQLGEEKWKKAISIYVKSNANKLVMTENFRKAVETASGKSMEWFFQQWLYKVGHPVFEVTKAYDVVKKQLTLKVIQLQKIDPRQPYPQTEFFQGSVDVEIDGRIERVWIQPSTENLFTFPSPQEPKLVSFDYESAWIKEIKFEKAPNELLYQLQNDKDILGRRWAMNELVRIANDEKTTIADREKIYAAWRDVILSNSYWRFRVAAITQLQNMLAPVSKPGPVKFDDVTTSMLLTVIKNEKSWLRASAITFLGATRDARFATYYISSLNDSSDRVVNAAANALGKSKSPDAFEALVKLKDKPSWKNQSLISSLNGLKELQDPRGFEVAFNALSDLTSPRWTLATPIWDFRIAAAETIVALGRGEAGYPIILDRFKKAVSINNVNDIFNNVLLITTLADPRGQEAFELLKEKFRNDANVMMAVDQYETQFKSSIMGK